MTRTPSGYAQDAPELLLHAQHLVRPEGAAGALATRNLEQFPFHAAVFPIRCAIDQALLHDLSEGCRSRTVWKLPPVYRPAAWRRVTTPVRKRPGFSLVVSAERRAHAPPPFSFLGSSPSFQLDLLIRSLRVGPVGPLDRGSRDASVLQIWALRQRLVYTLSVTDLRVNVVAASGRPTLCLAVGKIMNSSFLAPRCRGFACAGLCGVDLKAGTTWLISGRR